MNINRSYLRVVIIAIVLMIGTTSVSSAALLKISGNIFYENDSECNNVTVDITNLNTSVVWSTKTIGFSNGYREVLGRGVNVSTYDTLQFSVTSPDGSQSSVTERVVTSEEMDGGGFVHDIILVKPADITMPVITSVSLDQTEVEPNGSINVTVTATDKSGIASVTADGTKLVVAEDDTWTGTINASGDSGTHNVAVVATDAAGNVANSSAKYTVPEPKLPTISISDITLSRGDSTTVPITVFDVVDMGGCELTFKYDQTVVYVTDVERGDMNFSFEYNINNGSGWMRANALDVYGRSGDVIFAQVTFDAVGNKSATSTMEVANSRLVNASLCEISHRVANGMFSILPNVLPGVANISATRDTILYDNGRPRTPGTNTTVLSARVTDADGSITAVTIDLSSIGGLPDQPMGCVSGDVWGVITNAKEVAINVPDFTHRLTITATDDDGSNNDPASIELTVLKRGDMNGDGLIDWMDADYISRYLAGMEPEASVLVGDVVGEAGDPFGNGAVDLMDALYIAQYTKEIVEEP